MNQSEMATLRDKVQTVDMDSAMREMILQLIGDHETQQRAESFWSVRAPTMAEELERLREVERNARAVSVALATAVDPARDMGDALRDLDALRLKQAGA
jgi:hypothetical protein